MMELVFTSNLIPTVFFPLTFKLKDQTKTIGQTDAPLLPPTGSYHSVSDDFIYSAYSAVATLLRTPCYYWV